MDKQRLGDEITRGIVGAGEKFLIFLLCTAVVLGMLYAVSMPD